MLQQNQPDDYVIATGTSRKLEDFVAHTFSELNLDWKEYVVADKRLLRPTDIALGKGKPAKAKQELGWQAKSQMSDIVSMMIQAKI